MRFQAAWDLLRDSCLNHPDSRFSLDSLGERRGRNCHSRWRRMIWLLDRREKTTSARRVFTNNKQATTPRPEVIQKRGRKAVRLVRARLYQNMWSSRSRWPRKISDLRPRI